MSVPNLANPGQLCVKLPSRHGLVYRLTDRPTDIPTNQHEQSNIPLLHEEWHNYGTCIYSLIGKKHCGKRRKCWLPAFSPSTNLLKVNFVRELKLGIVW